MIKSIRFQNFKALRDATLPLGPFTLIVGSNGSGKSTVMQALRFTKVPGGTQYDLNKLLTVGIDPKVDTEVKITIDWVLNGLEISTESGVRENRAFGTPSNSASLLAFESKQSAWRALKSFRVFSFDAKAIASAVDTAPNPRLGEDGSNLAAVLDALRDTHPEKFEELRVAA